MADTPASTPANTPQRILIVALNYAPEQIGCAKYTTELAEALHRRGHRVEAICAPPYYPWWAVQPGYSGWRWRNEARNGIRLHRTPLYVPPRPTGVKRLLHLASFGAAALPPAIATGWRFRPQLVFAVAPTLTAAPAALAAAALARAQSWLHIQDFEVDAAFDLGLLASRRARSLALGVERSILRRFDRVSSISPAMTALLARKGVAPERIVELRNWVDVDSIQALPGGMGNYRAETGVPEGNLVALYSGNMAAKQGIELLAQVAAQVEQAGAPIRFLFCGDGPARPVLEAACQGRGNVRFLPLQPAERLNELLNTADMHLLPQRAEAADLVLPSKLTGMLASGRPVVAMALPGSGLAAEMEGCGLAVAPTAAAMTAALLTLSRDPETRLRLGAAARLRAEQRWRMAAIIDGFEARLQALTANKPYPSR